MTNSERTRGNRARPRAEPERPREKGAIERIRLRNFMTYTDTTIKPGPNLNMVLGPNGSGKSAIVCSIIVGLAGEVSLTGRATSPAGLIKKGCDWGSTEIELYNDRHDNYVIKRKIIITRSVPNKLDHKSEWMLNGQTATKGEIQKLISKLNIKVDNLCQFLPQDSVAAFVKMNTTELLTSTLKAAGDNQLIVDHEKLIDLTREIQETKTKLNRIKEDCEHNEVNCARLEADVEKLREREKLVEMKKTCDQKICHVRYIEAEENLEIAKRELNEMKQELQISQSSSEPYLKAVESNKKLSENLARQIQDVSRKIPYTFELVSRAKSKIDQRKIDCQQQFGIFQNKQEEETQRAQKIQMKQLELRSLENNLVELNANDHSREIETLKKEMADIKENLMRSDRSKSVATDRLATLVRSQEKVKARMDQIMSYRDKRMNILMSKRPDAFRVTEWYTKNKDQFQQEVYPPMMCYIDVENPADSALIEHFIHDSDLLAFVCQTESDFKKLSSVARKDLKARINIILRPDKTVAEIEADTPQLVLPTDLPFRAWLKDLIVAPDAILRYLCGNYRIHRIPVFTECTEQQLSYLLDKCRRFYVGESSYNISYSRYDHEKVIVTDSVAEAKLLIYSFDKKGYEECNAEYKRICTEKTEAESERNNATKQVDTLKNQWTERETHLRKLNAEMDSKNRINCLIERCKVAIEKLKTEKIDIEAERIKLQDAVKKINLELIGDVKRLVSVHKDSIQSQTVLCQNTLMHLVATRNHKISVKLYENAQKDSKRLAQEIEKQERLIETLRSVVSKEMAIATEKISGFQRGKLDKRTTKKFDEIVETTVNSLEEKIEELKARIQGIHRDPSVLSEFERQNQELQDRRQKIAQLESTLDLRSEDLRNIKDRWMPKFEEVIGEIDVHYREYMRKLKYDGQVKLDFDQNNAENFATYGIMIMVRYRDNEQLIPLSSTRQSGGERSVATMIYMLALQTITTVPFRCVDEINQGMDKVNERKVFELLVQTADESSSQYFLVSPKLLKDLPYSDKMKIHVVFNGTKLKLAWNEFNSDDENEQSE